MKRNIFPGIALALFMITTSCNNDPIQVWQSNPHYFFYRGKPLVLITSDHHYGAVIDTEFDFEKYLDYLSANGMNLTRIYPGGMFEPMDKWLPGNPLGPRPGRQLLPWNRSDQAGANPLLAESGKPSFKYDLDRWDPQYFIRLREFVALARRKNIIVEIAFFNGMYADCWPFMALYHENNIQHVGQYETKDCGLFTTMDFRNQDVARYQKEYIKKIVEETNEFDNVIFDICDEPSLQGLPDGNIIVNPDSMIAPWIRAMSEAFREAEESLPVKHVLGQTVQNLSPDLSDEIWCHWLAAEYVKPAKKALDVNYKNNKPIINVESNYFGISLTKNAYTVDAIRAEGWWFMLGGGAGCINLNGEFYRGQEAGGENTQKYIVPQRKILKDFMLSFDLAGLSRFSNLNGIPADAFFNALAENGEQYALYLFHGSYDDAWGASFLPKPGHYRDTLTLQTIPAGTYSIEWIDPASGSLSGSQSLAWKGGDMKLMTPPYSLDIALKMLRSY